QLDIPENAPKTTRRAIIFVRRSGAAGLGHIGWAFEWKNGWFNTGSVENRGFHAFARPELSDFWTAHTTNPLASMQKFGKDYDEYKLFFVKQPHPRAAWRVVVWTSRLSYWVIRRNCVDSTYDILRTYGITNLPDPATHYAPNDWYDSLQGPSYALAINPTIPVHISQQSHRQLVIQEIALTLIPTRVKATIPSWRQSGLRGLAEINMSWSKMASDIQASFTSSVRFITTHWKRWRKLRKLKTLHYHSH
ncbi:MAG TPA: hypothetical protein VFN35_21780, partial [Ktedonobacteraceae bacterium]|nr:hypothetical protein [Ktedonobacteraceae bacterium]